jgi:hypothetical protein
MRNIRIALAALLFALLALTGITPAAQADDDPPSRVARLNYVQGQVSFEPSGEQDWATAVVNRPMTTGDRLWADKESRAELHVGSTAFRIDQNTGISFLELNDDAIQLQLSEGTVLIRLRHLDDNQTVEVDAPNVAVILQKIGEYRIDTNENGDETVVSVFSGQAQATGGGQSYTIISDQQARFAGTDTLQYSLEDMPAADDFDEWCFSRDGNEDHVGSVRYVSSEVTGYEDLDEYGSWTTVPDYGQVWVPSGIAEGWAPYRMGHWAWIAPWGWTWVDDEPWGFAPFHYGRWGFYGSRWCWVPGPIVPHPFWAPALVAFVGVGGGVNLSVSVGAGIGWFPLAPGEVFVPGYRVSRIYVNNINITNTRVSVTNITNVYNNYTSNKTVTNITYANQRIAGGVTAVSKDTFVNSRPVAQNLAKVDPQALARGGPVSRMAPVTPTKQSVFGAAKPTAVKPPPEVANRTVVAKRSPSPPEPSFDQKQPALDKHPGQPLTPAETNDLRQKTAPAPAPTPTPKPAAPSTGFQTFKPTAQPSNPYVRPAPPVQPKTDSQVQQENETFKSWQQRQQTQQTPRPQPAPKPAAAPKPSFQNNHMPKPSSSKPSHH